jgi:SAM-dependent methyltransferase
MGMDDFIRYLAAKKTVDDRALNAQVWQALAAHLPPASRPLAVLEVGAGIGTMVERVLARGLFSRAHYTAIDAAPGLIAVAQRRLPGWAQANGFAVTVGDAGNLRLRGREQEIEIATEAIDLFEFATRERKRQRWDVIIAHAVLDLLDIPTALSHLLPLLRPDGLLYGTLTFDGITAFLPELDVAFDARIEALYHRTMDARVTAGRPSGDSRSGRRLFGHLAAAGMEVLAAGGSDWLVFPQAGRYPHDEAFFLRFIVQTVQRALAGHPELDAVRFAAWIAQRQAQVERGELVYLAHQVDVLARAPSAYSEHPATAPPAP